MKQNTVKIPAYIAVAVLTTLILNPRSAGKLSEMAFELFVRSMLRTKVVRSIHGKRRQSRMRMTAASSSRVKSRFGTKYGLSECEIGLRLLRAWIRSSGRDDKLPFSITSPSREGVSETDFAEVMAPWTRTGDKRVEPLDEQLVRSYSIDEEPS